MNKTLLAAALAGACASAHAQTNVTIYGSFDGGIRYQNHQDAAGHSRLTMGSNGTYNSNRIGFKGTEELGAGMNAHFVLETGFNSGSGTLNNGNNQLFERSAFVGLGMPWGSIDLGRQFTVAYKIVGLYDPFDFKYSAIVPASQASTTAGTRVNNDIQYTGVFGPITARAEWALGEQAGSARSNSTAALGAAWAGGPFALGGAYTWRKPNVAASGATANFQDNRAWTLGGAWTLAAARVAIGYARETQDNPAAGASRQRNAWIGGSVDTTPVLGLAAGYYHTQVDGATGGGSSGTSGKRQLFIVGATYKLSKRTNFYADLDYARYTDALRGALSPTATNGQVSGIAGGSAQLPIATANGQGAQTGFSLGINHVF
jgi:predicted porin